MAKKEKNDRSKNRSSSAAPQPSPEPQTSGLAWAALGAMLFWSAWVCRTYFAERHYDPGLTYLTQIPYAWFLQMPWNLLGQYLQTAFLAFGFFFSAFHLGSVLLANVLKLEEEDFFLSTAYSVGLGFAAGFVLIFVLGASQLLYPAILRSLYAAALAWAFYRHWRRGCSWNPIKPFAAFTGFPLTDKLLTVLSGLFFLLYGLMVFVPELFYDALVYHLAIPKYYLLHHGIRKMEFLAFSTFPHLIQLFWSWALALQERGEMLVKALHFGLTALTVFGIYGFCRREADRTTGLFAGLFYYSAHYIAINSWSCGNDAANSFLAFLAMAAMVRWCVKKQSSWWIASALFAGLSLSAKYTSLYGVAAVGLVWGFVQVREWWASRSSGSAAEGSSVPPTPLIPALGRMTVWCAIVFALFSPWLVKNAVWVGNPVHPFFYRQFGDQNINRSRTLTEKAVIPGTVLNFQQWSLERLFTAPWWLTMTGNDSVRGIGPVFLLFLPLLIFLKGMPRGLRLSLAVFGVSAALWYVADPLVRYLTTLPGLSMALAWLLVRFSSEFFRFLRGAILLFAAAILLGNWGYLFAVVQYNFRPWGVLSGRESRDQFLMYSRGSYPNPSYGMFKYANEHLPQDGTRILFLGENKAYYLNRDFIHSSVEWNDEPMIVWLKASSSPEDLYQKLRKEGVTHLLVSYREAIRNIGVDVFSWKEKDQKVYDDFWKGHVRFVAFQEGSYLYRIVGPEDPEAKDPAPPNLLLELQRKGWTTQNFIQILADGARYDEAISEVESLVRLGSPLFNYLASLHLRRGKEGDMDRALYLYEQAARVEPKNPEIYFQAAIILARKGDRQNALRAAEMALQLNPGQPQFRQLYQQLSGR